MARLKFGAFLAPHHPIGEHPMLQFRRDLDLVEQLDALGYDEFWCGEHHSSGWEMIASPEMFLAAAGERTKRIMLGTGVVSLPYHHPYNVAQRMVQLDWMTGGRHFWPGAKFGLRLYTAEGIRFARVVAHTHGDYPEETYDFYVVSRADYVRLFRIAKRTSRERGAGGVPGGGGVTGGAIRGSG